MSTPMRWPIAPMKATSGPLPAGEAWMYEPKWDGHRALVRVRGDQVDAVSSSGQARLARWPWLAALADGFDHDDVVLDGEVIGLDDQGRHSFQLVGRDDRPHAFVVFDLLQLGRLDLTPLPWDRRRAALEQVLDPTTQIFATTVTDDAEALMAATAANGFEGVIAKRHDSIYLPGRRTTAWIKVKHRLSQEFVVGGYVVGEGSRASTFGSLVVGYHEGTTLRCAGAVGTGLNERTLRDLWQRMATLRTDECPFDPVPKFPQGRPKWLRPELVVQVSFAEWTEADNVRHPVFEGLREDKRPNDVVREA